MTEDLPRDENGKLTNDIYKHKEWYKLRSKQLKLHPYCKYCADLGFSTKASYVDHVKAHRGDDGLFFAKWNLQSLCPTCHNSAKQREEVHELGEIGCGPDGWPRGVGHFWNGASPIVKPLTRQGLGARPRRRSQSVRS